MHLLKAIRTYNYEVRRYCRRDNPHEFPILLKSKSPCAPLEGYVPIFWNPSKISRDSIEKYFTIIKEVR